jgi:hypothetical protein
MRAITAQQTSFTSGELDPRLKSRIDVSRYYNGAALLQNVLVEPQGGVKRRAGLRHLAELPGNAVRLTPFAFNVEQTYCLAFVAGQFHVFSGAGTYLVGYSGQPWTATQATQLNFAQSADTLLLFHPDIQPRRIRRAGSDTNWTIDLAPFEDLPTYDYGVVTVTGTVTISATTGTITITASAPIFANAGLGWELKCLDGIARIATITNNTTATAGVIKAFSTAGTTPFWTLEEPVISAARGWPECGTFHDGRLWLGGLRSRPSTLLASRVGNFFNFLGVDGLDDEGLMVTIDSDEVNAIHALRSGRNLQIFTAGSEYAITVTPPITPTNISLQEQGRRGIKRWCPTAEVDGATIFVQRGGAALRQAIYSDVEQAYRADIVSLLAPHLTKNPVQIAARKGTRSDDADLVFLVNEDGTVSILTTLRAQEVTAFSRLETAGLVLSVAALADGQVFFAVLRQGTIRVERWEPEHRLDASRRIIANSPTTTVSNLGHLEGQTVALYGDRADLGQAVVTGGAVTLPVAATTIEVGLPVEVRVLTLPFEARSPTGPLIGKKARIHGITARVQDTGPFLLDGKPAQHRGLDEAANLDDGPPRVTADIKQRGRLGWQERIEIEVSQPFPGDLHLLALAYDAVVQT